MNDHVAPPAQIALPLQAMLIGFPLPLALGALLADWAYARTFQVQWINFADWLVAGSIAGAGLALIAAVVRAVLRRRSSTHPDFATPALLLLFILVQFFNALVHAKDAFATMPAGLVLSMIATILALLAAWFGSARISNRDSR